MQRLAQTNHHGHDPRNSGGGITSRPRRNQDLLPVETSVIAVNPWE
ncbi:hypothetical protein SynA15127_01299 [Synechococcus sp. A15-127]|nr:hypothetical protein SynA15127_01299 [Synechococcus sp. A15-127]